jgi:hypothetical protein
LPRNHRKPGVVRFVCTDARHRGSGEFRELGHHHVYTLRLAEKADGTPALFWEGVDGPVKDRRRENGEWVLRFCCSCGRDPQRGEGDVLEIVARHQAAFPGRRPVVDIVRLERVP